SFWSNCTFQNNVSSGTGGAVFLAGANIIFKNCLFQGNTGDSAGAMGFEPVAALSFQDCKFIQNVSEYGGGAISAFYSLFDFEINRCEFRENKGGNGGAIFVGNGAERLVIKNSLFEGNHSDYDGGAIFWPGSHDYFDYFMNIEDSEFHENNAEQLGGALAVGD